MILVDFIKINLLRYIDARSTLRLWTKRILS
jgi:hypothetical protein